MDHVHHAYGERPEANLHKSVFFSVCVCVPGINTDAIRLGVMHLDLLSHITGPINVFLA